MLRTYIHRLNEIYSDGGLLAVCLSIRRFIEWRLRDVAQEMLHATGHPLRILRTYVRFRRFISPGRYTDADPFKIISVDPNSLQRTSEHDLPRKWGQVKDGDWDLSDEIFDERTVHTSIEQRFVEGCDWKDTDYPQKFCEKMEDGGEWGFTSESQFMERCREIDELYNTISSEGYRSQRDLLSENPQATHQSNNDAVHSLLNEICVDIARDGELLWRHGGQHRLSIAKILEIEEIPVLVVTRHTEWQELRDKLRESTPSTNELKHPDLQDLGH